MGVSTDAILCFGITVEEDEQVLPWQNEDHDGDIEEWIAKESGLVKPTTKCDNKDPVWNKYWEDQRKAVDEYLVEEVTHCHGEYPMYVIAIRGTVTTASRGYPKDVNPAKMLEQIDPAKIKALKAWCKKYEVEYSDPTWILCSYWSS